MGSCGLEGVQGLLWHLGGCQRSAAPGAGRGQLTPGGDLLGTLSPPNAETHALAELDVPPSLEKRGLLSLSDLQTVIFS